MHDRLLTEQVRLIAEAERQAVAARRSVALTVQQVFAMVAFGAAPNVPHAERIFGDVAPLSAALFVLPAIVFTVTTFLCFRRFGADHWAHRLTDVVETFLNYGAQLAFIFASGLRWSPLWALCPFSAVFFAFIWPFRRGYYRTVIALAHGGLTLSFALQHRGADAVVALAMGGLAYASFEGASRVRRNALLAEADRNVARGQLHERQLEHEQESIALVLADSVAGRLGALVGHLQRLSRGAEPTLDAAARQAAVALAQLEAIVSPTGGVGLPATLDELGALLDRKLLPLCADVRYASARHGTPEAPVAASTALAVLRIAQEWVRNAITHGASPSVSVELEHDGQHVTLWVRDEGTGLSAAPFALATGGLQNARRWAAEQGGQVHRSDSERGTALQVSMPAIPAR